MVHFLSDDSAVVCVPRNSTKVVRKCRLLGNLKPWMALTLVHSRRLGPPASTHSSGSERLSVFPSLRVDAWQDNRANRDTVIADVIQPYHFSIPRDFTFPHPDA